MKNRASSSPADVARPWHRERWPWLLAAGPFAVVIASLASAWVAARSDDGVVAQDYYKRGLLINQILRRSAASIEPVPGARLSVATDRRVRLTLSEVSAAPVELELTFVRPGDRAHPQRIELARSGEEWVGAMPELVAGLWIVSLASERWQLPTTVVDSPFTELALGSADRHP